MFSVGFWILFLLPFVALFPWIWWWKRGINRRQERVPATLTLLRPPGELLRLKVQELDDKLSEQLAMAILIPMAIAMIRGASQLKLWPGDIVLVVLSAAVIGFFGRRAFKTLETLRNYRLGFHGEPAVGEQLNQLMLHGCRVQLQSDEGQRGERTDERTPQARAFILWDGWHWRRHEFGRPSLFERRRAGLA